LIRVLNHV